MKHEGLDEIRDLATYASCANEYGRAELTMIGMVKKVGATVVVGKVDIPVHLHVIVVRPERLSQRVLGG